MKGLAVFFIVLLVVVSVAGAADYEVKKKVGELDVTARIDKNPPVAGKNNLSVHILDKSGKVVSDAKVVVEYGMPAMPGMPPHNAKRNADFKEGIYKAVMDLSMRGAWNIEIKITRDSKPQSIKFTVDAQ